ncbi:MAG: DUF4091 domain-containing protein [Cellulosilyticaceae bacterium]
MSIEVRCLSSLEKVFLNQEPKEVVEMMFSRFQNEKFAFQIAYRGLPGAKYFNQHLKVEVDSPLKEFINVYRVGLVPSEFPAYDQYDENYLTNEPGLFPDPLFPLEEGKVKLLPHQWRALWIEIGEVPETVEGTFAVTIRLRGGDDEVLSETVQYIKVLGAKLPEQKLIHTEWFHVDCISNYYGLEIYSEGHWARIKQFLQTAKDHGINMILTPIFTPPLDTEIGGERPTVQLVDVICHEGCYTFGFEKLERWIRLCQEVGITYYEMSHLFTQWGAKAIPKIMAEVDGEYGKLFGWDDEATDVRYQEFLEAFIPQLIAVLKKHHIEKHCYFHVSDEPALEQLENYKKAKALLKDLIEGFPMIDALSDIDFYRSGAIEKPIPANDHIDAFIEAKVPGLWTYYCCGQNQKVSNRFMAMPSYRNRILATQLFKYDIEGFLHWGYNFWNVQFSKYAIDPFKVTDAGGAFPSGDAFLVYPGEDGPITSIRMKVFHEALTDLRAMQYLASLTSKDYVLGLIEKDLKEAITFDKYPQSADYILQLRSQINQHIMSYLA